MAPLASIEQIDLTELDDCEKVEQIKDVLTSVKGKREQATENLEGLRNQLECQAADAEYYSALEARSLRLQKRVSEIVKVVEFTGPNNALMEAIICWNYVYATQLIAREQDADRRAPDSNSSDVVPWQR